MFAMRKYISVIAGLSCLTAGSIASAQLVESDIDYSQLLEDHKRQQEEQWRPLFEVMLLEDDETVETPAQSRLASEDTHASQTALFLPDEDGKGGLLLLPRKDEFDFILSANNKTCSDARPSSDQLQNRAAAYAGDGASFALRGVPSDCDTGGFAFSSEGQNDESDIGVYLSPALAECLDGACTLRGVKGEIRVGELKESEDGKNSWYMYAAADGTRVVWDERPSGILDLQNSVDVSDSLTMGDLEAGILLSRGTADLSLNYVHRRSKFSTWDDKVVDNADYIGVKISFD